MYRTGVVLLMYKDDSEMFIKLSKKLSNFSMMFYRETSQLDKIDM